MKKNNLINSIVAFAAAILSLVPIALHAQDNQKNIHTENKTINRNGKDSTITIIKEDKESDVDTKRTIVIKDGDTVTNIVLSNAIGNGNGAGASIIIDGDSIVKIRRGAANIQKKSIVILNGDSVMSIKPDGGDVNIDIDTAGIREKCSMNKSLLDVDKKGIIVSDKYVIINLKKLSHKDASHAPLRNVVGRFGLEGFDLGFTQFVDGGNVGVSEANHLLDLNVGKSVNVNFRVADLMVNLADHKLYLDAGLEFDLHDYRFNNNVTIEPNVASFNLSDSGTNFSKNKLSTQYLELPLMLCYNSNPEHQSHSFTIGAGGYYGILLGSYTKQISDADGTQRIHGDFHCNGIDYGFMAVVGFSDVQLYGKFNASPLFNTASAAPDLQSFTFGIRLFHGFSWS